MDELIKQLIIETQNIINKTNADEYPKVALKIFLEDYEMFVEKYKELEKGCPQLKLLNLNMQELADLINEKLK
jgi:hypothetical protein